ncbi:hypothetical protein RUM43_000975 [Polyplax serrata]|uniref:C-type lectin domain-containing protein n=1 Tax=Polyplax serrata TaxID=468196 RepID=A0AAN8SGY5_POLSC
MIVRILVGALSLGMIACEEKWSLTEEESTFEPGFTVLENWTAITERNEKIMKSPQSGEIFGEFNSMKKLSGGVLKLDDYFSDRYIVTRPTSPAPVTSSNKDVSETDLFLLGAIEKLAYRLDFLEKRLQRTEQMLYQVIAGSQSQFNGTHEPNHSYFLQIVLIRLTPLFFTLAEKADPCPEHFVRYGTGCFHVSTKQLNWKSASSTCRNLGAALVEFETSQEESVLTSSLQLDANYRGKDYWTGGLNPGLLWIWSNSAKPIQNTGSQTTGIKDIEGNGRCLLMAFQPPTRNYRYKGAECSLRHYFICKYQENSTGRKLEKLQRALRLKKD